MQHKIYRKHIRFSYKCKLENQTVMNHYIDCYKHGIIRKRYSVTQVPRSGRDFLKKSLNIDGYETKETSSENELLTGKL